MHLEHLGIQPGNPRTVKRSFLHPTLAQAILGATYQVPYISHDFMSLVSVVPLCDHRIWRSQKFQFYPRIQRHRPFACSEWEVKWPREKKDYCCKRAWPAWINWRHGFLWQRACGKLQLARFCGFCLKIGYPPDSLGLPIMLPVRFAIC